MYLCLEGIKGTGKTSAYEEIKKKLDEMNISYSTICPTKPITGFDIREILNSKFEFLRNSVFWSKWVYSHRSNFSAIRALKENRSVIIGDRSKLTSYVVKRMQGKTWEQSFSLVDKTEKYIPIPDVIIYFKIDPAIAFQRVKNRKNKFSIKKDETLDALISSGQFYNELKSFQSFPTLSKIRWIEVNGNDTPEQIAINAVSIISESLNQL